MSGKNAKTVLNGQMRVGNDVKPLKTLMMSGREVLPLVEGGKGISVSSGLSSGAWAAANGVGTFSGVNADFHDENGNLIPIIYHGKTRRERHVELIAYGIRGGIAQAKIAHDVSGGKGPIHMNVLWEMGGADAILSGVLEGAKGLVDGVTCGAGMPYRIAEIASSHHVYYYPIVSSARAFSALWKRAYHKYPTYLGGVVYEDPWLAGGHNGLSNSEDPVVPQPPLGRVIELRKIMRQLGVAEIPIIMAGGVWYLREWEEWIDSNEIGPIAFQFGTRPLLTQESPISPQWKKRLLTLDEGDVLLHKFSPTGFYSSAVKNKFIMDLVGISERQVTFSDSADDNHHVVVKITPSGKTVFVKADDSQKVNNWISQGYTRGLKTPDDTVVFVTEEVARQIHKDQTDCMGCLSACSFSNWSQGESGTTGKKVDPRSFCIQKTLQNIAHNGDVENELMFAGHNAYRFSTDPFYAGSFIPTVQQLINRIMTGD